MLITTELTDLLTEMMLCLVEQLVSVQGHSRIHKFLYSHTQHSNTSFSWTKYELISTCTFRLSSSTSICGWRREIDDAAS